jgi:dienelactone hydrolase
LQVGKAKATAAAKHTPYNGSDDASTGARASRKGNRLPGLLADPSSAREWRAWKLAAAGLGGRGMLLAESDRNSEPPPATPSPLSPPEEVGEPEETEAGTFRVFKFPLSFSSTALYWRRFGVDVPRECEPGGSSCPLLFDFHGSYDSLYTQRNWTMWYQYQAQVPPEKKFILVTPEGSPDAVTYVQNKLNDNASLGYGSVGTSATSWNVLGWGDPTPPAPVDAVCTDFPGNWQCFESALTFKTAYPCYSTQLEALPYLCASEPDEVLEAPDNRHEVNQSYAHTNCTSASKANDWEYMKIVVEFVARQFNADKTRIYFTGQSMGGMAALQFSVAEGKYALPKDLQPAAIASCSSGGSRMNQMQLYGKVPTQLMWGFKDDVAAPVPSSGYARALAETNDLSAYQPARKLLEVLEEHPAYLNLSAFPQSTEGLLSAPQSQALTALIHQAMQVTGVSNMSDIPSELQSFLLYADVLTGGALLEGALSELSENQESGCRDSWGEVMSLDDGGIMWEGISTTLSRIVGYKVDWASLQFEAPASVPEEAASDIWLKCARVPDTQVPIRVCIFDGGHSYPWNGFGGDWTFVPGLYYDDSGFLPSAQGGKVFHDFIYEDFFLGGSLRRSA